LKDGQTDECNEGPAKQHRHLSLGVGMSKTKQGLLAAAAALARDLNASFTTLMTCMATQIIKFAAILQLCCLLT